MRYRKLLSPVNINGNLISMLGLAEFPNGRIGIQSFSLIKDEDGGDGTATEGWDRIAVNLPDQPLPDDGNTMFFLRDHGHTAATVAALIDAGIVIVVPNAFGNAGGHGRCKVGQLTPDAALLKAVHFREGIENDGEEPTAA